MTKLLKRTLIALISFTFIFSVMTTYTTHAFYGQDLDEAVILTITPTWYEIEAEHQRQLEELLVSQPELQTRQWREVLHVPQPTRTERFTFRAGGQPAWGTVFPNTNSGFNWVEGGASTSVSVGVSFGTVSISISGGGTVSSVGGNFIATTWANTPVHLYVTRVIEVRETRVYMRSGTNLPWRYYTSLVTTPIVRTEFSIRRA